MSFFEFLASEKATQDDAFRTASVEASREVNERFTAFASAYGEEGLGLITAEVEVVVQHIADRHGVGDRSAAITKAALLGLTNNPLLDERKHWSQEDWNAHYQGLADAQAENSPAYAPDSLVHRPGLDRRDPNEQVPRQLPIVRAASEPVPKMDKRKWTPKTVGPLKGVDDPKGPNPTKHLDRDAEEWTEDGKPIAGGSFKTKLEDIGEQRTEHYDLNRDKQKA